MTCLIGHCVSIVVVGLGVTTADHASARAREQHAAGDGHGGALEESPTADGKRVRVAALLVVGWTRSGMRISSTKDPELSVSSWPIPDRSGAFRLRRFLISIVVCISRLLLAACDGGDLRRLGAVDDVPDRAR